MKRFFSAVAILLCVATLAFAADKPRLLPTVAAGGVLQLAPDIPASVERDWLLFPNSTTAVLAMVIDGKPKMFTYDLANLGGGSVPPGPNVPVVPTPIVPTPVNPAVSASSLLDSSITENIPVDDTRKSECQQLAANFTKASQDLASGKLQDAESLVAQLAEANRGAIAPARLDKWSAVFGKLGDWCEAHPDDLDSVEKMKLLCVSCAAVLTKLGK